MSAAEILIHMKVMGNSYILFLIFYIDFDNSNSSKRHSSTTHSQQIVDTFQKDDLYWVRGYMEAVKEELKVKITDKRGKLRKQDE